MNLPTHLTDKSTPRWLHPAAITLLILTLAITAVGITITSSGVADPRPVGTLILDDPLDNANGWISSPQTYIPVSDENGLRIIVPAEQKQVRVISPFKVTAPGTLEVEAHQIGGESDARYGLWWGRGSRDVYTAAAINGDGYFAVWQGDGKQIIPIQVWQTYPWVRMHGQVNRLRVNFYEEGEAELLINDEFAARWEWSTMELEIGFYVETLDSGESSVIFQRLKIWQIEP
jgi:hypothetical protein